MGATAAAGAGGTLYAGGFAGYNFTAGVIQYLGPLVMSQPLAVMVELQGQPQHQVQVVQVAQVLLAELAAQQQQVVLEAMRGTSYAGGFIGADLTTGSFNTSYASGNVFMTGGNGANGAPGGKGGMAERAALALEAMAATQQTD